MKSYDFKKLEEVFNQALALDPQRRDAFLEQACGGNTQLANEVCQMLELSEESDLTLRQAVASGADGVSDQAPPGTDRSVGRILGSYRLESLIGQGGMGEVYLASRIDGFDQKVAIKFISDMAGKLWEERFQLERQLLASLSHPGIAQVLDGGEDENGRSFVVMEYIDGCPIDDYCRRDNLTISDRLTLFLKLCDAVQYAHSNLIVHRDIKPGNVLVDQHGNPKLLDFGIAKLVPAEGESQDATVTVAAAMTPRYASPEQILGQPVSVASDIYSLGVLIYELLCGMPAHRIETNRPSDIERAICHTTPPLPSRNMSDQLETRDRQRAARRIRGDLDHIVMMAMRKEPSRRYASVGQLAEDINRYLEHRPVIAQPDSGAYRVRKFVSRYPVPVSISALFILSLVTFGVTMAWQAGELAKERDRARLEAESARQATEFMTDLFQASDPLETAQRELTAKDLLEAGAARIDSELESDPLARARLLHAIGMAYTNLGELDKGIDLLSQALEIRRAEAGDWSLEVADSLNRLGNYYRRDGQLRKAEPMVGEALRIRERMVSGDEADLADSYNNYGLMLYDLGRYGDAGSTLTKAIDMHSRLGGRENGAAAFSIHNLALVRRRQGMFDEAVELALESLAIKRATGRQSLPTYGNTLGLLAETYRQMGNLPAALSIAQQSLEARRSTYAPDHFRMGTALNTLGSVERDMGLYQQASQHISRALEISQVTYGEKALAVASARHELGLLYLYQGNPRRAAEELGLAVSIEGDELDPDNPRRWNSELSLGAVLMFAGDMGAARPLIVANQERLQKRFGAKHPQSLLAQAVAAELHRQEGDFDAAESLSRQILDTQTSGLAATQARVIAFLTIAKITENPTAVGQAIAELEAITGRDHPILSLIGK